MQWGLLYLVLARFGDRQGRILPLDNDVFKALYDPNVTKYDYDKILAAW